MKFIGDNGEANALIRALGKITPAHNVFFPTDSSRTADFTYELSDPLISTRELDIISSYIAAHQEHWTF